MSLNKRQQQIVDKIEETDYLSVQDLSTQLNVSSVTIRKDLTLLEEQGFLFRTHGGASKQTRYAFEQNVSEKENIFVEEKKLIAQNALKFINNNDFIILASGTTIHYLARGISNFENLTVLTPSLKVALELCKEKDITTVHLGGEVRKSSTSTVGTIAENVLKNFSCNKLFLGVDGIDIDFGISTSNASEAYLNQKMIEQSDRVIILADSSKVNRRGFGRICGIDKIDTLITDSKIDPVFVSKLRDFGIQVVF